MAESTPESLNTYCVQVEDKNTAHDVMKLLLRTMRFEMQRNFEHVGNARYEASEDGSEAVEVGSHRLSFKYDEETNQLIVSIDHGLPAKDMLRMLSSAHKEFSALKKRGDIRSKLYDNMADAAIPAALWELVAMHYGYSENDTLLDEKNGRALFGMPHAVYHKLGQNEPFQAPQLLQSTGAAFCELMEQLNNYGEVSPTFGCGSSQHNIMMGMFFTGLHAVLKTHKYEEVMQLHGGLNARYDYPPFTVDISHDEGKKESKIRCSRMLPYLKIAEWYRMRAKEFMQAKLQPNGF